MNQIRLRQRKRERGAALLVTEKGKKEGGKEGRKERKAATARLSVTVWAHPPHRNSQK